MRGILQLRPWVVLTLALALTIAIAITDWKVVFEATLGFLYMFPLVLLGAIWNWPKLLLAAAFCTYLSDRLDAFPVDMQIPRDALIFTTLATAALLSRAVTRGYRREMESVARAEREMNARRAAEEQLKFLVESSPAAVLTMSGDGRILLANPAAHGMFGMRDATLAGRSIAGYVPALAFVPSIHETDRVFRTQMQTRGQRADGEAFLADVFFATYRTPAGARMAAVLVDTSEHLREREEANLEQLLAGSRILVAAVSHEVRNVCGAIGVMYENLSRQGAFSGNTDFDALGSLVDTLEKIASLGLKQTISSEASAGVDLNDLLTDFRIVLAPCCEESGIALEWAVPTSLPLVEADRASLLQVLLNLTKNSTRALESVDVDNVDVKKMIIAAELQDDGVRIRVSDNGPGISEPGALFQPLQKGADATGLGLYLSRAFVRSFRGDLRYDPLGKGCSFVIDLALSDDAAGSALQEDSHATYTTLAC
jgi:PAS domain S-box-containing protein